MKRGHVVRLTRWMRERTSELSPRLPERSNPLNDATVSAGSVAAKASDEDFAQPPQNLNPAALAIETSQTKTDLMLIATTNERVDDRASAVADGAASTAPSVGDTSSAPSVGTSGDVTTPQAPHLAPRGRSAAVVHQCAAHGVTAGAEARVAVSWCSDARCGWLCADCVAVHTLHAGLLPFCSVCFPF